MVIVTNEMWHFTGICQIFYLYARLEVQDLHLLLVLHLSGKHALCGYLSLHEKADTSGTLVPKQHVEHIKEILGTFIKWTGSSSGFFSLTEQLQAMTLLSQDGRRRYHNIEPPNLLHKSSDFLTDRLLSSLCSSHPILQLFPDSLHQVPGFAGKKKKNSNHCTPKLFKQSPLFPHFPFALLGKTLKLPGQKWPTF